MLDDMARVARVRLTPRAATNAVGVGYVIGPDTKPTQPIPVVVQVSWDDEPKVPVLGLCLAWTRDYAKVQIRDDVTALSFTLWFPPGDVDRLP